jgi:hypothetical protein
MLRAGMKIYQHDNFDLFRFRLIGVLDARAGAELELCWRSAASALRGRPIVADVSELGACDEAGIAVLRTMRDHGVRFIAPGGSVPHYLVPPQVELTRPALGQAPIPGSRRTFSILCGRLFSWIVPAFIGTRRDDHGPER